MQKLGVRLHQYLLEVLPPFAHWLRKHNWHMFTEI